MSSSFWSRIRSEPIPSTIVAEGVDNMHPLSLRCSSQVANVEPFRAYTPQVNLPKAPALSREVSSRLRETTRIRRWIDHQECSDIRRGGENGCVGTKPMEPTHVEDTLRKSRRERNWFRMRRESFVEPRCSTEHHERHAWNQMAKKESYYKKHNCRNHAWHLIVRVAALTLLQPYPYHERCLLVRW